MLSESRFPSDSVASAFRRTIIDGLLAVLLAPTCAACDRPLAEPRLGPVCQTCWDAIVPITPPVCESCGDPLPSWRVISLEHQRCPRCRRGGTRISRGRAIGEYAGSLRAIVHALKYDGRRSVAKPLAARLVVHGAEVLDGADSVVPVPLHRSRRRARGFNQAEEIARHLPVPMRHALKRVRATPSQTELPAAERHANVRNAFALRRRASVKGAVLVLVDDVSTTGATLDACARVLLESGACEVRTLTAARVVARQTSPNPVGDSGIRDRAFADSR
jgi:ComF family protein